MGAATQNAKPYANSKATSRFATVRVLVFSTILLILGGITVVSLAIPRAMQDAALEAALQGNLEIINQVKLMRGYYTQNVVARALQTNTLKPSMNHHGKSDEIPLPATLVKDLSALMAKRDTNLSLVSPYPWPHRADRKMDEFETEAWKAFQVDPDMVFSRHEFKNGQRVLRVAVADRLTTKTCVDCHNTDPLSVKRDWVLGDVRAVFEATRVIDSYFASADRRSRMIIIALIIGAVLSIAVLLFFTILIERRTRAKEKADEQAYFLAEHDGLTGLTNRAHLCASMDLAFQDINAPQPAALMLIDLDKFKQVNDNFGHGAGDIALIEAAKRMRDFAGPNDLLARLGGDEFAILCMDSASAKAMHTLGEQLCARMAEPIEANGARFTIGASIGIARFREDGGNTTDLLLAADLALYSAKGNGRGKACLFNPEMNAAVLHRRALEADMLGALARDEFILHYQPIVSLRTGQIIKIEALLRWNHPVRGMISPAEFIPIAEDNGLIVPIGAWVARTATKAATTIDPSITVAINLSPVQIGHDTLLGMLEDALEFSGLPAHRLEVEITESLMMQNDGKTLSRLEGVRQLGIKTSLDDFGTGYSCLSYLQNYPVNCVKIDRSFVQQLGQTESSRSIIRAIIALANALDMDTVAEGVETELQLKELHKLGCGNVQGYLLGRPKPIEALGLIVQQAA